MADDRIRLGGDVTVSLQRTLRVPEDGGEYPLPPGFGSLPVVPRTELTVEASERLAPDIDALVPMYEREALWLAFDGPWWRPVAVQVGLGEVNAVSGGEWVAGLEADPQNYVVAPDQPWLDGANSGTGSVRQFVAVPLGTGRTVEALLTGRESVSALRLRAFPGRPGRFPDEEPAEPPSAAGPIGVAADLGLGAGGAITQRIHPDRHGIESWQAEPAAELRLMLVDAEAFAALTGRPAPPTPIDARTYTEHGLPWFERDDAERGDVPAAPGFAGLPGTGEPDAPLTVPPESIRKVRP